MNYIDRMNMLSSILMGVISDIPSLDKIFCSESEEEFIKNETLNRNPNAAKGTCYSCKTANVIVCKYGFVCTECLYKIIQKSRKLSSNVKILCRGYSDDKTKTSEEYYSRGRFLPTIEFTENYKLKIFDKEVEYRVYFPEKHPFTNYEAPMPNTFITLMIDVYGAMHDSKPILGYFTAKIMGNYFCVNFATGKSCRSYSTGKTISKLSDIGMSLVDKPKDEKEKSKGKVMIRSKCHECSVFKGVVLSAYGIE